MLDDALCSFLRFFFPASHFFQWKTSLRQMPSFEVVLLASSSHSGISFLILSLDESLHHLPFNDDDDVTGGKDSITCIA